MRIDIDPIVKIQAEQLLEWTGHPEVFKYLLEQALQQNVRSGFELQKDAHNGLNHRRYSDLIWRGQTIDIEAVSFLKEVH
jgi:hypothetical protein